MNPFVARPRTPTWIVPVSGMCLVLGFMISMAWVTTENRRSRFSQLSADQSTRISSAQVDLDKFTELSNEVGKLREEKTRLENALAGGTAQTKVLNEGLQEAKAFAGLTEVEGPGVVVTLRDSRKAMGEMQEGMGARAESNIHDMDVLQVTNELFASGAEAVSINKHRVATNTSIRCVGSTILVDDVRIAPPVVIRAIGDPDTLYGGMNLNGGVLSVIRIADPEMVAIEKTQRLILPAYAGTTGFKVAKVPGAP